MIKKTLIAGTALVALAASTYAFAQTQTPPGNAPTAPTFTKEDRQAFVDARIAGMKAALKLTPEQEKLWPAVEKAMRDNAAERIKLREASQTKSPRDMDPIERIRFRATHMGTMADGLKKLADASEPLYKTLDENQKRRLTFLTRMGGRGDGEGRKFGWHRGHHGGMHHFRGNWGGEDGMRGPGGPGMGGPGMGGPGMGGPGGERGPSKL
jgi:hypothetical protein